MTVRSALLAAALLLLVQPAAAQAGEGPGGEAAAACLADGAAPPCGYIVPQLSLEFANKPACRAETLGGPIDLSLCIPLPPEGGRHEQQGLLRFSWDVTQDGTYPADPMQPIVISFSGTATNPKWMAVRVEPAEVTLDAVALANPTNMRFDETTQQVWFWYEVPLTVTFERTGSPDEAGLQRIERAQGVTQVFLKAKSSASGAYYKEAFGVEEFRFNSCAEEAGLSGSLAPCGGAAEAKDAPSAGLAASLAAVGAAALAARRRKD